MADETRILDTLGQSLAVDGVPQARPLAKKDMQQIKDNIDNFEKSLKGLLNGQKNHTVPAQSDQAESGIGKSHHCFVLAGYLGRGYKSPAGTEEAVSTEEAVLAACQRRFGGRDRVIEERINVILESSGGSLDSAYRTVLFLRKFAKELHVYVPWRAKSAATLIAIGADKIVMSPYGELGPLDTQIADPRNPTTLVSALDCYRSVDYVRDFGVESIARALKVMLDKTREALPLSQLIDSATDFAAANVRPMLEQVKALDFGGWGRTLKIGENYAKELRLRLDPDSEADAANLARTLVYGYTHHKYPIDQEEATRLGLNVKDMAGDVYDAAKAIADSCRDDSRFVGFSADAATAIEQLGNRTVRGRTARSNVNGLESAHAVDAAQEI